MKYAYEDLGPDQFEDLVVAVCRKLFGIGVMGFSRGPDGGRDAKFVGTAELFPSRASPWEGTTIIQAKHTIANYRRFSDPDFCSLTNKSSVLKDEIPRIRRLREDGELDNYLLVSNRKLGANVQSELTKVIAAECNIPEASVFLVGVEVLEGWMKSNPEIAEQLNLDPIDSPLNVSPDDLAEVVEALAQNGTAYREFGDPPTSRIPYEDKNRINNMSLEYARELRRRYLKETRTIDAFLAAPENMELLERYRAAADEFELNIIAKRRDYDSFDEVINYLARFLTERDPALRRHSRLTRTILFYMYWNCDVGSEEEHAQTH